MERIKIKNSKEIGKQKAQKLSEEKLLKVSGGEGVNWDATLMKCSNCKTSCFWSGNYFLGESFGCTVCRAKGTFRGVKFQRQI